MLSRLALVPIACVVSISLHEQEIPAGYVNLHWSSESLPPEGFNSNFRCECQSISKMKLPASGTIFQNMPQRKLFQNGKLPIAVQNCIDPYPNGPVTLQHSSLPYSTGNCYLNEFCSSDHFPQKQSMNNDRSVPIEPFGTPAGECSNKSLSSHYEVVKELNAAGDGREILAKLCYTWREIAVFKHLIREDHLLSLLANKKLRQIRCTAGCNRLINPKCVVEYIKNKALQDSESALSSNGPDDRPAHPLASLLLEKFIEGFGPKTFLYLLGIRDSDSISKFRDFCSRIPKTKENTFALGRLLNCLLDIKNYAYYREQTNDANLMPIRRGKTNARGRTIASLAAWYFESLEFANMLYDDSSYREYRNILSTSWVSEDNQQFLFAQVYFLLSNPYFPVGMVMNYLIPFICGRFRNSGYSPCEYALEYKDSFRVIEMGAELVLECIIATDYTPDQYYFNGLMHSYLKRKEVTIGRILNFISRNAELCDSINSLDTYKPDMQHNVSVECQMRNGRKVRARQGFRAAKILESKESPGILSLRRFISNIVINYSVPRMHIKDLLKIENLLQGYPVLSKDMKYRREILYPLQILRSFYIDRSEAVLNEVCEELREEIREMARQRKLLVLDGIFELFKEESMMKHCRTFFEKFYPMLPSHDMQLFYLPSLVRHCIIMPYIAKEVVALFEHKIKLQIGYLNGILLYMLRKLGNLQSKGHLLIESDKLVVIIKRFAEDSTNYERQFRMYIVSTDEEYQEVKVFFGLLCYYNYLLEAHFPEMSSYKISLDMLESQDYSAISAHLNDWKSVSMLPEAQTLLGSLISTLKRNSC